MNLKRFGWKPMRMLLPTNDFERWGVIACDQYTSQPEYWEECEKLAGGMPSALRFILPEAYLDAPDVDERIQRIHQTMQEYLDQGVAYKQGVLQHTLPGFILVKRQTSAGERLGLVISVDLEKYSYIKGAKTLIRPTEETIEERIPPRLKIRRGAALETSHVMLLLDDPACSVIEPLFEQEHTPLYSFDLMQDGGHIEGWFMDDDSYVPLIQSLEKLLGPNGDFLLAVGDGNHSLAAAKAYWEEIKKPLTDAQRMNHPARFAQVEVVNLHSEALVFEPIHRVVLQKGQDCLDYLCQRIPGAEYRVYASLEEAQKAVCSQQAPKQAVVSLLAGVPGVLSMLQAGHRIPQGTLQPYLEAYAKENGVRLDYIHGDDSLYALCGGDALGLFMPAMDKQELFTLVDAYGTLPKKTFSMGQARDKRYYVECKRITLEQA
ncbi:MAG: DUF1015 domain-containing protein [Christensenellales bacterium]|jgi:hypothetical protein